MKNFILISIAILLAIILFPFGILYALFTVPLSPYFRGIAESINQMGNHIMGPLFNQWMTKAHGYKFGNIDETVSSALGKNKRRVTLTKSGKFLDWILNSIDKNHSIDAIEENP